MEAHSFLVLNGLDNLSSNLLLRDYQEPIFGRSVPDLLPLPQSLINEIDMVLESPLCCLSPYLNSASETPLYDIGHIYNINSDAVTSRSQCGRHRCPRSNKGIEHRVSIDGEHIDETEGDLKRK